MFFPYIQAKTTAKQRSLERKIFLEQLIIGIDTGNRCMKTRNAVFVAGMKQFDAPPAVSQDVIAWNGKYYVLSNDRISYLQDKTQTEEYFVLTLFAIVKELIARGVPLQKNVPIPVCLGVGLPPSHIARLKERFLQYFNRGQFNFRYNDYAVCLRILDVKLLAQGYAVVAGLPPDVRKSPHAYIVDIGGCTTDIMALERGALDPRFCESLDYGMIQLCNQIQRRLHLQTGKKYAENMIDEMLESGNTDFPEQITRTACGLAEQYVSELLRKLLEFDVDLTVHRGVFVGGGAMKLQRWIASSDYVWNPYFVTDIRANAIGYETFVKAFESRKKA